MREQDILDKIRESAEEIEIPEALKPENIEQMLREKSNGQKPAKQIEQAAPGQIDIAGKSKEKKRFQPKHLMAAAVALVLMLGLVPLSLQNSGGNDTAEPEQVAINESVNENNNMAAGEEIAQEAITLAKKEDAGELYRVAESYDEIYAFIEQEATFYYDDFYYTVTDGIIVEDAVAEKVMNGSLAVPTERNEATGSTDAPTDFADEMVKESVTEEAEKLAYSETNVQMAGVDESDIVKTNGTHIFMVKDDVVTIARVKDGQMEKVGMIAPKLASFTDCVLEMYVDNDRLVLIVQQAKETLSDEPAAWGEGPVADDMMVDSLGTNVGIKEVSIEEDVAYSLLTTYNTVLYTYDISNPARPVQIGSMEQDGNYYTSRKIDDIIYLFTYDGFTLEVKKLGKEEEIVELLPKVNGETFTYDNIYLPRQGSNGLVVSSVSLTNPDEIVDKTLILNDYVNIYVSNRALYLYNYSYLSGKEVTEIAKFTLDEGRIAAVAASSVPGTVQDTFAINEYDGNLRVLTTGWNIGDSKTNTNQLYIFDENLTPAGKIENIAPGETIYAARYFGDLAYFITYRNMDPLFAADLSDIHNPKILGELEITGYSEYLHMWGEDKLLGIGYETNPKNGNRLGIKLVMFDISNPAELKILDTVVMKDADYSAALQHYKCVLADARANIIGFTTTEYRDYEVKYRVFSFSDGEFKEELTEGLGEASSETRIRGLYIGDYFYIVDNGWVGSYNRSDSYQAVSEFEY